MHTKLAHLEAHNWLDLQAKNSMSHLHVHRQSCQKIGKSRVEQQDLVCVLLATESQPICK